MGKKVKGTLVGINGNAFMLIAHFQRLARKQGFEDDWIKSVIEDARSEDYDHLLRVLSDNMTMEASCE